MVHLHFSDAEGAHLAAIVDDEAPEFAPFWQGAAEHLLRVQWCVRCRRHQWPPRPACGSCGGDIAWTEIEGRGELYSWTVVHLSPLPAYREHVPYVVALAELPGADGIRVLARLAGDGDVALHIGAHLDLEFEDIAPGVSLPVWHRLTERP